MSVTSASRPRRSLSRPWWWRLALGASVTVLTLAALWLQLPGNAAVGSEARPEAARAAVVDGSDWPTFLGPQQDGRSAERGILSPWPPEGPKIVWQVAVGEGYSMPSVADGRLLLFDRAGDEVRLRALDATTGGELWRTQHPTVYEDGFGYSNGPRASPVIDGDLVFTFGVDGWLRCHRLADGRLVWEIDTARRFGVVTNFFGAGGTPTVEGDLLIAGIGGSPPGDWDIHRGQVEPNGSAIVAFDKLTGAVRYQSAADLASYSSPIVREIAGRRRGLYFARGGLVVFDPRSGQVQSQFPWRARKPYSVNAATPIVVGDEVFLTESYEVGGVLLSLADGQPKVVWKDPPRRGQSMAAHWGTPVYDRGFLYGSSGENSGSAELRCIDWSTGEVKWSVRGLRRSTLLYADGHLIVLSEYGQLLLIKANPERFELISQVELRAEIDGRERALIRYPAWNAPILSRGRLYVLGKDRLVALELIREG